LRKELILILHKDLLKVSEKLINKFCPTALHIAVQNHYSDTVEYLVENGADVNLVQKVYMNSITCLFIQ